jgi:hypothetical protein
VSVKLGSFMMAVDLHSTELLLPSHFLYDEEEDDILAKNLKPTKVLKESSYYNPWEAPQSALSSPVGSELGSGSAESESDKEDDYIAELARQMAHYMLQDDDKMEKKVFLFPVNKLKVFFFFFCSFFR